MVKSIRVIKKSRGRPKSTGTGTLIGVRLQDDALAKLDVWANEQNMPSRPEAVRQLIDLGLRVDPDCPPLTDEELKRFRPAAEVLPDLVAAHRKLKRTR